MTASRASSAPSAIAPAERDGLVREALKSLKLAGAVFLRAHFSAPWAYESPNASQIRRLLQVEDERIILFHVITAGRCRIELAGGEGAELVAGDIAIMPFCDQHTMGNPDLERPVPLPEILPDPIATPLFEHGGGGPVLSMVCGYLRADAVASNALLATLPRLIRVSTADGPLGPWVDASIRYAMHTVARERVDDPLLQRLPELLFTECLCDFVQRGHSAERGWLAGLRDPVVGRALACMHQEPERPWTLKELARRAASSRSVLDARFRELLGQAPMSYLTAFRLDLAARRLRTSTDSLATIASTVGYGSEAGFSRAFKRHAGVAPSAWRAGGLSRAYGD